MTSSNVRGNEDSKTVSNNHPILSKIPMSTLADYELYNQLGQGTFGVVTKARQLSSGKLVALKKFIINDKKEGFPITAFREITIMKKLKNVNILQIVDMVYEKNGSFFYTVCPYISSDLNGLLNNPRISLSIGQIKNIMIQLLSGINYVHQSGYLHRDIKTANILLDHFGTVKIADFGLARLFHGPPPSTIDSGPGGGKYDYTGLVVTRWYRPPELLLGDRKYTTAVDIWGIGCVFAELFIKKPILEGKSDVHQAELIFKLLGSPNVENFPNCHLINRNGIDLKNNYPRTLESHFETIMPEDSIELLSGLLTLNPMKRFNALKALDSSFFKVDPLPCDKKLLANLEDSHESDVKRFKEESKSQKHIPAQPISQQNPNHSFSNNNQPIRNNSTAHPNSQLAHSNMSHVNNSLNHSRYGVDSSSYMSRTESTTNIAIPNESNPDSHNPQYNSNDQTSHHYNSSRVQRSNTFNHQLNNIQRHLAPSRRKRYDDYSINPYDYSIDSENLLEDYYFENDHPNKRSKFRSSENDRRWYRSRKMDNHHDSSYSKFPRDKLYSSRADGSELYGSKSSENSGYSILSKLINKRNASDKAEKKDDSNGTVNDP